MNKIRGTFNAVAVKALAFGDRRKAMMQDIATLTGGQVIAPEVGLKLDQVGLEVLGQARRVVVTKDETTIVEGGGETSEVEGRVNQIKAEIAATDSDWDREKFQERLAKLAGGVLRDPGRGHRGRAQGEEAPHRGRRLRDARRDRGGHRRRWRLRPRPRRLGLQDSLGLTGDEAMGVRIVARSVDEPLRWIAENGGVNGYVIVAKVREAGVGKGYNAATGEHGDLVAQGVLDPVKVTRSALVNAASIAGMLLTTETLVVEKPEEEDDFLPAVATVTATGTATEPPPEVAPATTTRTIRAACPRRGAGGAVPSPAAGPGPGDGDLPCRMAACRHLLRKVSMNLNATAVLDSSQHSASPSTTSSCCPGRPTSSSARWTPPRG